MMLARSLPVVCCVTIALAACLCSSAPGQTREAEIVESAASVLDDIMDIPAKNIPVKMLANAQAVAIIPNVVKGSFVVGVRHGRGVVVIRDASGSWHAPTFITLTGGSVGWQVGVQSTDVILVFKTQRSVDGLMRGKFTIGADVAVAAGPIGRQASAATDVQLRAEILSYSRSRGLFAGVSLEGSALQVDALAGQLYYQAPSDGAGPAVVPPSAVRLIERVVHYTRNTHVGADAVTTLNTPIRPAGGHGKRHALRTELANASLHLYGMLDQSWQRYLALPAEVFKGNRHPSHEGLRAALDRFNVVVGEPRYRTLATQQEFQRTHGLLKQYANTRPGNQSSQLSLPSPPR